MSEAYTDISGVRHGEKALVINPVLKSDAARTDNDQKLQEVVGLARAIDLDVAHAMTLSLQRTVPATLLGQGQVAVCADMVREQNIVVVIVNHPLTPVQQRNLERDLKCKVVDRTGIILEIFGDRARTREGKLQVELAALDYQKSRLVKSWTHLERQRGGFGFMGGPGESQLEVDRRLITNRIARLKQELDDVRRTRHLGREARQRAEHPTIALVGYTNAGKSTLFNRLTNADIVAKDMLFATLDPTMRGIKLPSGRQVILSDTVGFIADLPTHLVESFRATLEEVQLADVILHVRDVSHPNAKGQREAVIKILSDLGISGDDKRLIDIQNKIDALSPEEREHLAAYSSRVVADDVIADTHEDLHVEASGGMVGISALTGEGIPLLLDLIEKRLSASRRPYDITIDISNGAALSWLHQHGRILKTRYTKTKTRLTVELDQSDYGRYIRRFKP